MILNDVLGAWSYWTKTPNVIADSFNAVGFAVSNPKAVIFGTPKVQDLSGGVSFADGSISEKIANNPITKVANTLSVTKKNTVIRNGEFIRQNQILNGIGQTADAIDETVLGTAKAIFGSDTFLKVALIAGGAFALYKFGGEFVKSKGAQFARR